MIEDSLSPVRLRAEPFTGLDRNRDDPPRYFLLIASVGFEERSSFVATRLVDQVVHIVGFTFPEQRVLSYAKNRRWFEANGQVVDVSETHYRERLAAQVSAAAYAWQESGGASLRGPRRALRVAVDISSMTRQRLADTFLAIYFDSGVAVDVDWLYAPATYSGSGEGNPVIRVNQPLRGFEGWGDPDSPLSCVLGAGFEGELALGVVDDLEPSSTWVFLPVGYSKRHDSQLLRRNEPLLSAANEAQVVEYRLDRPLETLLKLEALVERLVAPGRAVLIPLGPKLFALLAMVIGASNRTDVSVWRVSADVAREPVQRRAAGDVIGLRIVSCER